MGKYSLPKQSSMDHKFVDLSRPAPKGWGLIFQTSPGTSAPGDKNRDLLKLC
jgi:hypothetical protein